MSQPDATPKLTVLMRTLTGAYELLDTIGPNVEHLMPAELAASVSNARHELWTAMGLTRKEIEANP